MQIPEFNTGLPSWANNWISETNPRDLLTAGYRRFGEIFSVQINDVQNVFICNPFDAKTLLVEKAELLSAREGNFEIAQLLFGDSILYSDGIAHKRLRNNIQPHFSGPEDYFDKLESFIRAQVLSWKDGLVINIQQTSKVLTLRVIAELFLKFRPVTDWEAITNSVRDLSIGLYATNTIDIPFTRFGRALRAMSKLKLYISSELSLAMERAPLIDSLLDSTENSKSNLDDVVNQVNTLLFAGYDTTSSVISWATWYLLDNPEVLKSLKEEIETHLPGDPITYVGIRRLSGLSDFVDEVIRLKPPVYFIPRMVVDNFQYKDFDFKKGMLVNIVPLFCHQNPSFFNFPDSFSPGRYKAIDGTKLNLKSSLIGFGVGPKACLGYSLAVLEIKLFLFFLIRNYNFSSVSKVRPRDHWLPGLHPSFGPKLRVSKIN